MSDIWKVVKETAKAAMMISGIAIVGLMLTLKGCMTTIISTAEQAKPPHVEQGK